MIQMVPLETPEAGIARFSEVEEIVDPFLTDVALHHARKKAGHSVHGKQEAQWRPHGKNRQGINQRATDVQAVERLLVMLPMERIEALMEKAANHALARGKAAVKDVTVKEIFDQGPHENAREIKGQPDERMPAAYSDEHDEQRVRCVENRKRVHLPASDAGLLAFVAFE